MDIPEIQNQDLAPELRPERAADLSLAKEEFLSQVKLALADVLEQYRGQASLLRPRINACLEENFGIRSREVNLQIPDGSQGFSLRFTHPDHGEMTLEA